MDIKSIISVIEKAGHSVFTDDSKPYNLNIAGLRSANRHPVKFDDTLHVFWKYKGKWNIISMDITTDPGEYYLQHPLNKEGTAIMVPDQYRGVYSIGQTKGHDCLRQVKPIKFWRDNNRDAMADITDNIIFDNIYAHIHGAGIDSELIGKWSAACQVIPNRNNLNHLLWLCREAVPYWGDSFSYTLIQL